ncbi:Crp/Fnr family transcriptional regulator [Azospirillum sp.]|uniref:Crp/Fnr family transcriptional regulator n=1 Tax=Azospirillum sp. TaxID=34012 RepID=UPI003D726D15
MLFSVGSNEDAGARRAMTSGVAVGAQPAARTQTFCSSCQARAKGMCAALSAAELSGLAAISRSRVLASGLPVIHEGEHADAVYTVMSGMLKLFKMLPDGRQQITGFASAGDMIGLSYGDSFAYTAETITAATVCRFPRTGLSTMMARHPHLQGRLLAMTSIELTAAQDQILLLGCKNAAERIGSFLLALARRAEGAEKDPQPTVFLPMQKTDMSAYLGLRPETLSRQFRKLEDAGLIERVAADRIRLLNPDALSDMAGRAA